MLSDFKQVWRWSQMLDMRGSGRRQLCPI